MLHRVQVTDKLTVQRRLRASGLHGQIAAKKPLLKDTNKKKWLDWAKKHEPWTLDFWFQPPCLCETQRRWTDDLCMCGSYREAWRRRCDGALLVTRSVIYYSIQGTLNQHGCHSILQQWYPSLDLWLDTIPSQSSTDNSFGLVFALTCTVNCRTLYKQVCAFPTVKHGGGGVMVLGCLAGDNVCDLFRIQGTLNQHGYA